MQVSPGVWRRVLALAAAAFGCVPLNAAAGLERRWTHGTNLDSPNRLAIGLGGTPYLTYRNPIYALSRNGDLLRTRGDAGPAVGDPWPRIPAVSPNGSIYVPYSDGSLAALDPSGTERWSHSVVVGTTPDTSLAVGLDGTVYSAKVVDGSFFVNAVAPGGTLAWTTAIPSVDPAFPITSVSPPVIGNRGDIRVSSPPSLNGIFGGGWRPPSGGMMAPCVC